VCVQCAILAHAKVLIHKDLPLGVCDTAQLRKSLVSKDLRERDIRVGLSEIGFRTRVSGMRIPKYIRINFSNCISRIYIIQKALGTSFNNGIQIGI
jgi:hypothetical protein